VIFVAAIIFVVLLYVFQLRILIIDRFELFPILGPVGSFVPTSAIIYLLILAILLLIKRFHELFWPRLPYVVSDEIIRRTGIYNIELYGFWIGLGSLLVFLATDISAVPLSLAAMFSFGWLRSQPIKLRPVGSLREARTLPKPVVENTGVIEESRIENLEPKKFEWEFKKPASDPITGRFEISVDKNRYRAFADKNPYKEGLLPIKNYKEFVSGGVSDEVVQVVSHLMAASNEYRFTLYEEVAFITSFIHSIPYKSDDETKGRLYLRYPVETLFEGVGDTNCKAILMATILKTLSYEIFIVESGEEVGVAVSGAEGIPGRFFEHDGKRFFFCHIGEDESWVGQLPPDKARDRFKVFNV